MNTKWHKQLEAHLADLKEAGTYKTLRYLSSPMDGRSFIEGKDETVILSSNNYLGMSNRPEVIAAGKKALDAYGAGTASVRFICGTFSIHRDLEETLADFLSTPAALSYVSCWTANTGAIPLLAGKGDAIISDELNHASIIDGVRLSKADRYVYPHSDMKALEARLKEAREQIGSGTILVLTDGVFSMEGDLAKLPEIVVLCEQYDAVSFVDDSHGTGVLGKTGAGVVEHYGLEGRVDVISGTLGKALGGAAGGYISSSRAVVDSLIQASRPQLFSNALPATIAGSACEAINLLRRDPAVLARLRQNTGKIRGALEAMGFQPLPGESAIVPIIVGQTAFAIAMSNKLLEEGVFVTGFGYPVVPEGKARIRIQASAALEDADIDKAMAAFQKVGRELKLID